MKTEEADGNLNKVSAGSMIHGIARMMNRPSMYAVWCILALQNSPLFAAGTL